MGCFIKSPSIGKVVHISLLYLKWEDMRYIAMLPIPNARAYI